MIRLRANACRVHCLRRAFALVPRPPSLSPPAAAKAVLENYADIAQAGYEDARDIAGTLKLAVEALLDKPTEANLLAARAAWIAARIPYMQTEAYRFGNPIVDDWEGKVNAWPLDEGLIDYVAEAYRGGVARERALRRQRDRQYRDHHRWQEARYREDHQGTARRRAPGTGGVEANVATGYHAIEFLLWGQDLNGTRPGNGARLATDFDARLHQRQLRAPRPVSAHRHRIPGRRSRLDGRPMEKRRRGAQGRDRGKRGGRADCRHDGARQSLLWWLAASA